MKKLVLLILLVSVGLSVLPSHTHVKSISPEISCLTITTNNQDESFLTNNCSFNITILNKNMGSSWPWTLEPGETFSLESQFCRALAFDVNFTDCYLSYNGKTSDMVLFLYNRSIEIKAQETARASIVFFIFFALFCLSGLKIAYNILKKRKSSVGLIMLFCITALVSLITISLFLSGTFA